MKKKIIFYLIIFLLVLTGGQAEARENPEETLKLTIYTEEYLPLNF